MTSLRQAINNHCKSCIYDSCARGTWKQQVTLCAVTSCELFHVRPTTDKPIPDSVLAFYGLKRGQNGGFSEISTSTCMGACQEEHGAKSGKIAVVSGESKVW